MYQERFSKRLREIMDWEDMSARSLSKIIHADRKGVRGWLQGNHFPRWDTVIKIADYFHVSIDFLVGMEDDEIAYTGTFKTVTVEEAKEKFLSSLKTFMQQNHLTIYAVAKGAKVGQKPVKNWLVKGSMPEMMTIIRLSQLMNRSIDSLFGRR